jgi:hypothetical protein
MPNENTPGDPLCSRCQHSKSQHEMEKRALGCHACECLFFWDERWGSWLPVFHVPSLEAIQAAPGRRRLKLVKHA